MDVGSWNGQCCVMGGRMYFYLNKNSHELQSSKNKCGVCDWILHPQIAACTNVTPASHPDTEVQQHTTNTLTLLTATFRNSPEANLAVFVPCGDAVILWVTGDARERVLASLLVVVFQEKPIKIQIYFQHDKSPLYLTIVLFLLFHEWFKVKLDKKIVWWLPLNFTSGLTCRISVFWRKIPLAANT